MKYIVLLFLALGVFIAVSGCVTLSVEDSRYGKLTYTLPEHYGK